jgi:chemotaxis response regulator CheB
MDGVEFVRRVRERSNVPVVFVSAWPEEIEKELRGTQLAADDYIAVPEERRGESGDNALACKGPMIACWCGREISSV